MYMCVCACVCVCVYVLYVCGLSHLPDCFGPKLKSISILLLMVIFFVYVGGYQPSAPPTWRTRLALFVWHLSFNLSAVEGPTSNCATFSIAL